MLHDSPFWVRVLTLAHPLGALHRQTFPSCYLLAPVAKALAQVEQDLRGDGFGLRLYDCYRPVRSVQAFMAWVNDPRERSRKAQQYPDLDKPRLLADGYIAERSGHSRGATVDLGLLDCRSGACTPLDMATGRAMAGAPRAAVRIGVAGSGSGRRA